MRREGERARGRQGSLRAPGREKARDQREGGKDNGAEGRRKKEAAVTAQVWHVSVHLSSWLCRL